ncbi:MAG: hypothetical protein CMP59_04815 [Flavobacteriales bacterium]|nr:hypothetical protein [Flavobacteriales bacterium]
MLFSATSLITVVCLYIIGPLQLGLEMSKLQIILTFFFLFTAQVLMDFLLSEYVLGYNERQTSRWLSAPIGILTAGFGYSIIQLSLGLL